MSSYPSGHSPKTLNIPSLDGIRALSFLLVFASHDDRVRNVIPGLLGVTVFFFLSGYLITTLMRIEIEKTGTIAIGAFYLRRALRIFPPFYLVMALILLGVTLGIFAASYRAGDLAAAALYISNYWEIYVRPINIPGFGVFWSLAVEEHFYLLFPGLMLLMVRSKLSRRTQVSVLLAICVAVLIWRCVLVFHFHSLHTAYGFDNTKPHRTQMATDTRLDSILFGSVLALWGNPILDSKPKHHWGLTLAGVLVILFTLLYRNPEFRETFRYTLQGVALMPLFICAIRLHDHWAVRWLNSRPLRFIGVLSYTLYLVHDPMLYLCEKWSSNRFLIGLAALSMSIVIAYGVHVCVERPLAKIRRRLGSRSAHVARDPIRTMTPVG